MAKAKPDGERAHVKDLKHDPNQVRRHNPRNIAMIGDSMQEVGTARSIVIDEDNVILAGNGTVEAAGERGITGVRIIEADGDELIAVRRRGLTPAQKVNLAIADNKSAELADWDLAALVTTLETFDIPSSKFFTDPEFRALTDREIANDLGAAVTGSRERASVPRIPEGYSELSIILKDEAFNEVRDVLEDVKTRTGLATWADAMLVIARAYQLSRKDQ